MHGEYRLTRDDVLSARQFEHQIGLCGASIEDHHAGTDTECRYLPDGQCVGIPFRTLIPLKVENLLVVGRCFSATRSFVTYCCPDFLLDSVEHASIDVGDSAFRWGPDASNPTLDLVVAMVREGFGRQIVLGMDTARRKYWKAYDGTAGLTFLLSKFVPRLREAGLSIADVENIFVSNPASCYAFASLPANKSAGPICA